MNKQTFEMLSRLERAGIKRNDAYALRRIAMTLHRWHELECGDSNNYGSWAIERDEVTEKPYMVTHHYRHGQGKDSVSRYVIPDREKGARKRLAKLMERYPEFVPYIQGDPRGAALYIIPKASLRDNDDLECCYSSRGIAIYK